METAKAGLHVRCTLLLLAIVIIVADGADAPSSASSRDLEEASSLFLGLIDLMEKNAALEQDLAQARSTGPRAEPNEAPTGQPTATPTIEPTTATQASAPKSAPASALSQTPVKSGPKEATKPKKRAMLGWTCPSGLVNAVRWSREADPNEPDYAEGCKVSSGGRCCPKFKKVQKESEFVFLTTGHFSIELIII